MSPWFAALCLLLAVKDPARPREVVVLYGDRVAPFDALLAERLQATPGGANVITENLDLARFDDADYRKRLAGVLGRKHGDRHVDLVMPVGLPALRFVIENRDAAFPGVPVVFSSVDAERLRTLAPPAYVAGVAGRVGALASARAALELQPEAREILLVAGESPLDRYWRERVRGELGVLGPRVAIEAPERFTMAELLTRLRTLPDRTIVLYLTLLEDGAGSSYSADAVRVVAEASRVPVYAMYQEALGSGVVGGSMFSYEREMEKAAGVALRVLSGTPPEELGIHEAESNNLVFDWRALRRYRLDEGRLPPGSSVRFRPPSPWDLYRRQILAGAGLVLFLSLLVAGLLVEVGRRRRAERDLEERLRFETLLAEITRRLTHAEMATLDAEIDSGLRRLGEALAVDRAELGEFVEGAGDFRVTNVYVAGPDVPRLPPVLEAAAFPWLMGRLRAGQRLIRVSRLDELPSEATIDRRSMQALGTRAKVILALPRGGAPLGALGLGMLHEREWPEELVSRLELSAEVFGSALMRRRFERLLEESRGFGSTLFASIHGQVAVLDQEGRIVAVNEAWDAALAPVGANYVERCGAGLVRQEAEARAAVAGLRAVLDGAAPRHALEYTVGPPEGPRWIEMLVEPLRREAGGAVVTLGDVTDRKRAESEARRLREDLAHVTRVSTLGELAASLAHELNQPLTAILSNVQTAQILLRRAAPDLDEIREILADVADDDKRAGEVIVRLKSLFRKGPIQRTRLDVNELIREVLRLLQNDAMLRGASLRNDLLATPPTVEGDRIQLQQVFLNLMVNGLEAMRDQPAGRSILTIRSGLDAGVMWIEVADTGRGIVEADRERLFEPFHTTKATGMGMGLTIARSIVEAHGGKLSLASDPGAGAVFRVTIPTLV
jgi:signal transduction histidine kinase/ABC-type uncharacterized transport system substrate-binding protein